jgi:hypothetical protein
MFIGFTYYFWRAIWHVKAVILVLFSLGNRGTFVQSFHGFPIRSWTFGFCRIPQAA